MNVLLNLMAEFAKTGLFSVGGGLATLPFLYEMSTNHPEWFTEGFSRIIEIEIIGEGAGWLYIKIGSDSFAVEPWSYHDADAHIKCSYYHFMRMMRGETTAPRLFMKGRLKITGNLAKSFEIKDLLSPR